MDSVRFGRVLGMGARGAAKALAGAVDAATAPNPRAPARSRPPAHSSDIAPIPSQPVAAEPVPETQAISTVRAAARVTVHAARQAREVQKGVAQGSKRFGEAVWGPIARLSGVLWLEITGAFFGIFALFAGQAVWTHRADLLSPAAVNHEARIRAAAFLAMALVFGYFCVSSFFRARRRERSR